MSPGRDLRRIFTDSIFTGKFLRAKSTTASSSSGACVQVEYTSVPPTLRTLRAKAMSFFCWRLRL